MNFNIPEFKFFDSLNRDYIQQYRFLIFFNHDVETEFTD